MPGQEDKWWQKTIVLSSTQKERRRDLFAGAAAQKGERLLQREHAFCFAESIQVLQGLEIQDGQAWFEMQSSWHCLLWPHTMMT